MKRSTGPEGLWRRWALWRNGQVRRPCRSGTGAVLFHASLVLAACLWASTPAMAAGERLLVWTRTGVTDQDLGRGLAPYRMQRHRLGRQGWHVLTLPRGLRAQDMRRRLHQHPLFQHVEEDRLHSLSQVYNDTFFSSLWHLERLSALPAWATATGMGRGITVAVVDTGVQADHPDLTGAVLAGWNVVDGTSQTSDNHGHGTSVAGLLAARINNGMGVAGLAAGVRIMPIRVSQPDGSARTSDIAMGIQWAADRGARVVNVSFDGVMGSMIIRSAAQALFRQGGLLVAAAGNRGQQDAYTAQPGLMMVGALDEQDNRPAWATYGEHLALAAPGDGLWTTGLGGGYRVVWGTSFATPLVAAAAALVWEAAPSASAAQVEQWLRESAVDLGVQGPDVQTGHGRLNAAAAVAAARRWHLAQTASANTTGLTQAPQVTGGAGTVPSTATSATTTPAPSQMPGTAGPNGNAWLGVDVDTTLAPLVSSVQLSIGGQTLLVDPSPPFAFTLNLQDRPRGLLRVRLQGLNVQGAVIAQADIEVSNTLSSLIVSGIRLTPLTGPDVAAPMTATTPTTPTNRTGTGWSALRRTDAGRIRQ